MNQRHLITSFGNLYGGTVDQNYEMTGAPIFERRCKDEMAIGKAEWLETLATTLTEAYAALTTWA